MTKNNRTIFIAIWGVALVPVAAALLMYFAQWGVPSGRTNAGQLQAPGTSLSALGLSTDLQTQSAQGRWLLLITAPEHCAEQCQHWMHQLGQIKTALGRDTDRVEYYLVQPSGQQSGDQELRLVSSKADFQPAVWVADPLGNLVMRYELSQPPQELLSDLRRLLKASKIG